MAEGLVEKAPDEARASLLRAAAQAVQADGVPPDFAELLFGRTTLEDLADHDAASLAVLTELAWEHVARRTPGHYDIRIVDPDMPDGRQLSVVEIINDNMPFLFDSTTAEFVEQGLEIRLVAHPILAVERDAAGRLTAFHGDGLVEGPARGTRESLIHIHIDRLDDPAARERLVAGLSQTLDDVRAAVTDWQAMRTRVGEAMASFRERPPALPAEEVAEACELLQWLAGNNFTLLGVREYRFASDDVATAEVVEGVGLGILRDPTVKVLRRGNEFVTMTAEIREFLAEPTALIVTKANVKSRVHRRVHLDYVGVKLYGETGRLEGELRIVGLFTSAAYVRSVRKIPYLRRKVAMVLERADFDPDSHSGKAILHILEEYPRDELFQIDLDTLYRFALDILMLYERPRLRALARADRFDRFVSILVFVPREKYSGEVRVRMGVWLASAYRGRVSAAYASFPEGPLARVHFIIGRYEGATPVFDRQTLEAELGAIAENWPDKLRGTLDAATDPFRARTLAARYGGAFTQAYQEAFGTAQAFADIGTIERLSPERPIAIDVYRRDDAPDGTRLGLKVFAREKPLALSYRVPVIENHGLRVVDESTYRIAPRGTPAPATVWLHDMTIEAADGAPIELTDDLDLRLEASIMAVIGGRAESDGYNALVIRAGLAWREVATLRALSRYLRQARIAFSQDYMWATLTRNGGVAAAIVALFRTRFDPHLNVTPAERQARESAALEAIEEELKAVASLDEDRILRRFVNLVQAAVRTNLWQLGPEGQPREVISFKFDAHRVEALPAPRPLFEIFVYSPRVEGIHLRFGKVARGGLRWSDRPQDFRTEILGLVKAQQVKNAVIVPVGAKGGFVPKLLPPPAQRDAWMAEGTESYRIFIRSLLELTDNIVGDAVVPPPDTVRHDADDPYLVVAADKGTATFSDIANAISIEKGHWLGDAFASGGSQGYDHKKMGITARGAWEAVKRHFRELGRDIQSAPFTAVGVGDMSGDVFGNGMLLSKATRLVAAFDHRDIFLDPAPDPETSFAERARLFALPRSSWQDYDRALISPGGGVFSRSLKSVPLSLEVRALLDLDKPQATPAEIISAILRARVDLLWFGGIGTYVRASTETDDQVGDRANDPIRIAGAEVRAQVIGEGANLGCTQRGRIEAALAGVRLNTDAIDNSAGVNTSDIEVNLKIALARPEADGRLVGEERNALLAAMTDEVAELVLRNNYLQTLALSLAERRGAADLGFLSRLMQNLERRGLLDRAVEFLPDEAALAERARRGQGLTRPELAVLLAYAKLTLKDDLLVTAVPDDPYLARELVRYFPPQVRERFPDAIDQHRLRREIIATGLANAAINRAGPAAVVRLLEETGADLPALAMAFATTYDAFEMAELNAGLDALDNRIDGALQLSLYERVQTLLLSRVGWLARNADVSAGLEATVERFHKGVREIAAALGTALQPDAQARRESERQALEAAGLPPEFAGRFADLGPLVAAPDIVLIAERAGTPLADAAATYFAAQSVLRLDRLMADARSIPTGDHFERLAVDRAVDQIAAAERRLVADMLRGGTAGLPAVEAWLEAHPEAARIRAAVEEITAGTLTLAKLTVAAGLLGELVRD